MRMTIPTGVMLAVLGAMPAQAAPLMATEVARTGTQSTVDQVRYRRCWMRNGERHCRWVEDGSDSNSNSYNDTRDVGSRRPEDFRFGSTEWWRAMDRQGRGGFGDTH